MLLLDGLLDFLQQLFPAASPGLLTGGIEGHLPPWDGVHEHLEEDHTQAPHVICSIIHDGGRQVGDCCNELR